MVMDMLNQLYDEVGSTEGMLSHNITAKYVSGNGAGDPIPSITDYGRYLLIRVN